MPKTSSHALADQLIFASIVIGVGGLVFTFYNTTSQHKDTIGTTKRNRSLMEEADDVPDYSSGVELVQTPPQSPR